MTKTWRKKHSWKIYDQKLQFTYPMASIKDVQATGEAFSPQKKTSSTKNLSYELFKFLLFLWVILLSWTGSDPDCESGSG